MLATSHHLLIHHFLDQVLDLVEYDLIVTYPYAFVDLDFNLVKLVGFFHRNIRNIYDLIESNHLTQSIFYEIKINFKSIPLL